MFFNLFINFFDINIYWIDSNTLINLLHLYYFCSYIIYKYLNLISLNVKIIIFRFYRILIHKNVWIEISFNRTFLLFIYKKIVLIITNYFKSFSKRVIKPRRWWKFYYRFHHLSPFKILFFSLYFILFILMWKRRNTYLKRTFIKYYFFFFLGSIYMSFILNQFFPYYGSIAAILIAFLFFFCKLN